MAISTTGTYLTVKGEGLSSDIKVYIKSFPDLGAAPAAIEVTTLADEAQVFIPGKKGMAAMEFVANYDAAVFADLTAAEGKELTYTLNIGADNYEFSGQHTAIIVAGALNAAVDMKVVAIPSSRVAKAVTPSA
ncbi:Uncharacterised protein [uncultured Eubacterium sp.]|nr:Uncharacterised protein [uncultured Eubacterium sp.]